MHQLTDTFWDFATRPNLYRIWVRLRRQKGAFGFDLDRPSSHGVPQSCDWQRIRILWEGKNKIPRISSMKQL
jgi:hypothetical protein